MNKKIVIKSGLAYTFSSFLVSGMAFITTPIFTRILSKNEYGQFSNFTSWLSIASVIISMGLVATFISARFDWKNEFDSYIFSMNVLVCCVSFCVLFAINLFPDLVVDFFGLNMKYLNLMLIYIIFSNSLSMYQSREQYDFHYKKTTLVSVSTSLTTSALSILLVLKMNDSLEGRILGYTLPTIFVGIFISIMFAFRGRKVSFLFWKYALPISLPYIPHSLSLTMLNSMDRIMITKYCGEEQTALYSLAYTCSSTITILMNSMNTAYSPWLARNLNEKRYAEIKKFSYYYILLFLFLVLGIMLVSPEIMLILGGSSYADAIYVMPPVMTGCAMQLLYTMHVNIEQYNKKTIGMALASVIAAMTNLGLNILLIPKIGYLAAAYTTWISYLVLLFLHIIMVRRMGFGHVYNLRFIALAVLFSSLMMALMGVLYKNSLIRYFIIFLYIIAFGIAVIKNKEKIKIFFRNK